MLYDPYDERGTCRLTSDDHAQLLSYLRAGSRRPPRHGSRPYTLHVRQIGQVTLKLDLRMDGEGEITVTGVTTYQALANMPVEDALRHVLDLSPPPFVSDASTPGRSFWLRLRDPWPPRRPEPTPEPP